MTDNALALKTLDFTDEFFEKELTSYLARESLASEQVKSSVASIISTVRKEGDAAVLRYTHQYDGYQASKLNELLITPEQLQAALAQQDPESVTALRHAAERIRAYHEKQKQGSWSYQEPDGSFYGQKVTPLDRVGVYVPGGKANYPSSMLMLAIPAQVAGVKEIIATVPTRFDSSDPNNNLVFAAAAMAGVSQVYTIGGAQAIAALALGTESIPRVDKIAGPGNVFVTEAKKQLFGEVGIDMIAGPSELTVICDGKTAPDWIALDLFSQAEHDEQAQSILICPDGEFIKAVVASINRLLPEMERREIITRSLEDRGLLIKCNDLPHAAKISNYIAPEHLELSVADPESLLRHISHAGAIFLGRNTAEALGDYCAGPSHVLPTSGTARFFSALGVYDFQKRSSIINCSEEGALNIGGTAAILARREHLQAHALSAEYRLSPKK